MKEQHTRLLAFQLALKALEIPRSPAATNFLEVKLYYYVSFKFFFFCLFFFSFFSSFLF